MRPRNDTRKLEVLLSPAHQMEWEDGTSGTAGHRLSVKIAIPTVLTHSGDALLHLNCSFNRLYSSSSSSFSISSSKSWAALHTTAWTRPVQLKQQKTANTLSKFKHNQQIQTEGLHHQNLQLIRPGTEANTKASTVNKIRNSCDEAVFHVSVCLRVSVCQPSKEYNFSAM